MEYLKPEELLHNGWQLYWFRTEKEWMVFLEDNIPLGRITTKAFHKYTELCAAYRNSVMENAQNGLEHIL